MVLTFESFMRKQITSALSELLMLGTRVPDPPLGSVEALCCPNFSWECTPTYFFVTSKNLGFDVTFPKDPRHWNVSLQRALTPDVRSVLTYGNICH